MRGAALILLSLASAAQAADSPFSLHSSTPPSSSESDSSRSLSTSWDVLSPASRSPCPDSSGDGASAQARSAPERSSVNARHPFPRFADQCFDLQNESRVCEPWEGSAMMASTFVSIENSYGNAMCILDYNPSDYTAFPQPDSSSSEEEPDEWTDLLGAAHHKTALPIPAINMQPGMETNISALSDSLQSLGAHWHVQSHTPTFDTTQCGGGGDGEPTAPVQSTNDTQCADSSGDRTLQLKQEGFCITDATPPAHHMGHHIDLGASVTFEDLAGSTRSAIPSGTSYPVHAISQVSLSASGSGVEPIAPPRLSAAEAIHAMDREIPFQETIARLFTIDTYELSQACAALDERLTAKVAVWACMLTRPNIHIGIVHLPRDNAGVRLALHYEATGTIARDTPPWLVDEFLKVAQLCQQDEFLRVCKTLDASTVLRLAQFAVDSGNQASVDMLRYMRHLSVNVIIELVRGITDMRRRQRIVPALALAYASHPEWPELLEAALQGGCGEFAARLLFCVKSVTPSQADRAASVASFFHKELVSALTTVGLLHEDQLYAGLISNQLPFVAQSVFSGLFETVCSVEHLSQQTCRTLMSAPAVIQRHGIMQIAAQACTLYASGKFDEADLRGVLEAIAPGGGIVDAAAVQAHTQLNRLDVPVVMYLTLAEVSRDVLPADMHMTDDLAGTLVHIVAARRVCAPERVLHVLQSVHSLTASAYMRLEVALEDNPESFSELGRLEPAVLYGSIGTSLV